MNGARSLAALALSATLALAACGGDSDEPSPAPSPAERQTRFGTVVGTIDTAGGVYSWLGVPFAAPPVGELRWKAPIDPPAWTTKLATQKFGNACIQNGRIFGPGANNTYDATIGTTLDTPVGQEDCLTLSIWRPASTSVKLPVIVFLHGGSNISGYCADTVHNGTNLAKTANAVVVCANYRLGVLGFLNLPQLKTGGTANDASGNFAILDHLQALKFVQQNIEAFGGDAGNVIVMGQSAGAINTLALVASPLAAGMFHKAIALSGGISVAANLPPGSIPSLSAPAAFLNQGRNLLFRLLIADGMAVDLAAAQAFVATQNDAQIASYMRSKSAATLINTVRINALLGSGPIPEGTVVPTNPIAAITAGTYNKVPMIIGGTRNEGKLFAPFLTLLGGPPGFVISDKDRFDRMFDPALAAATTIEQIINPAYLPVNTPLTGWNAKTAQLETAFTTPNRSNVLTALKTQQANVWSYQFDWSQEPAPWNDVYEAAHAFDLAFLFGAFGPSLFANAVNSAANEPGRLALSSAMMNSVAAFAHTGDPNNASLGVTWPVWPAVLSFDATLTQAQIGVK